VAGIGKRDATLLYAAHDETVNHAVVLADYLDRYRSRQKVANLAATYAVRPTYAFCGQAKATPRRVRGGRASSTQPTNVRTSAATQAAAPPRPAKSPAATRLTSSSIVSTGCLAIFVSSANGSSFRCIVQCSLLHAIQDSHLLAILVDCCLLGR
jgi:hypothetical protein